MKAYEIIQKIETIAPPNLAEEWDNVGMLVGDREREVKKVLLALDPSDEVIAEAQSEKADMLITHHPLIFKGMKRVTMDDFIGRRIIKLIQSNIVYYAAHTSYDIAPEGMAKYAAERIGLKHTEPLEETKEGLGIGKIGYLEEKMRVEDLAHRIREAFSIEEIRLFGDPEKIVEHVAISPGSGKSEVRFAVEKGAEVLITGDIDHHIGLDAISQKLSILDAGHFGLEHIFAKQVKRDLQSICPDVEYQIAHEACPFHVIRGLPL